MALDFSFNDQAPYGQLLEGLRQKPVVEQQMEQSAEANRRQRMGQVFEAVQSGMSLVKDSVALSALRQEQSAKEKLAEWMALKDKRVTGPVPDFGKTHGELPGYQSELQSRAAMVDPKSAAKSAFPDLNAGQTGRPQVIRYQYPNKKGSFMGFADPNTKQIFTQNGQLITEPVEVAYAMGNTTDPVTGELLTLNRSSGEATPTAGVPSTNNPPAPGPYPTIDSLTLKQQEKFDSLVGKYHADPVQEASRMAISQISGLQDLLNTNVGAATEPMKSLAARVIAREKGVLTEQDVARNSGNQALVPRVVRFVEKWKSGELTDQDKKEFGAIIKAMEKNADRQFSRTTSRYADMVSGRFGIPKAEALNYMRLNVEFEEEPVQEAPKSSVPAVGQTFNGAKVISVKRIK